MGQLLSAGSSPVGGNFTEREANDIGGALIAPADGSSGRSGGGLGSINNEWIVFTYRTSNNLMNSLRDCLTESLEPQFSFNTSRSKQS